MIRYPKCGPFYKKIGKLNMMGTRRMIEPSIRMIFLTIGSRSGATTDVSDLSLAVNSII
jgi:hypothetical protein